jgi:hypothetical protein
MRSGERVLTGGVYPRGGGWDPYFTVKGRLIVSPVGG